MYTKKVIIYSIAQTVQNGGASIEVEEKSCFFIGHRDAPDSIRPKLDRAIAQCIERGITAFIVGQYGNFDRLAARALEEAKKSHPDITLLLLIPYHPAERSVAPPVGFDGTYYPEKMETVPRKFAIIRANRFMVDHSDYLIAYAWHPASNTRELMEYARKRERKGLLYVENLAEQ